MGKWTIYGHKQAERQVPCFVSSICGHKLPYNTLQFYFLDADI